MLNQTYHYFYSSIYQKGKFGKIIMVSTNYTPFKMIALIRLNFTKLVTRGNTPNMGFVRMN